MSYTDLLINTCTIQRKTVSSTDAYGQPIYTWGDVAGMVDIPCRHVVGKGVEIKVGQEVRIVYDQLFLEDIAITASDRVVLDGETWEILEVRFRQDGTGGHHKEASIQRVE